MLLSRQAAVLLSLFVRFYQTGISPILPGACRFEPSCSNYALEALQLHGPVKGLWLTVKRLLRCRPGADWGYDPVPPCCEREELNPLCCEGDALKRPMASHSTLLLGLILGLALSISPWSSATGKNKSPFPSVMIETEEARYKFSSYHGAMESAVLLNEQFFQKNLEAHAGVPEDRSADGPLDLVSTWDPPYFPLQTRFTQLNPDPEVRRVIRAQVPITIFGTPPAQLGVRMGESASPSDNAASLFAGDLLYLPGSKTPLGSLAGNGSGGVYQLSLAPGATAQTGDFTVNVVRVGVFSRVFSSDPRFQIIPSPKGSARFVWPNPERDESPLTIERLYRKKANYEIESILRFYWDGATTLKHRENIVLYGWAGSEIAEPSLLDPVPDIMQPACGLEDSTEHAEYDQTGPTYHGSADWAGIELRYFLLGAALDLGKSKPNCGLTLGPMSLLTASLEPNVDSFIPVGSTTCKPEYHEGSSPRCSDLLSALNLDIFATAQEITKAPGNISLAERKMLVDTVSRDVRSTVFAGPKDMKSLEAAGHHYDAALDFGMLTLLCKPLLWLLQFFYGMIPNWSIAIALLTIAVKILLLYWTIKGFVSMRQMQKYAPHTQAIKEKYKDDKTPEAQKKMQQEIFALYKKHGVNPMGGCLPMFIQMPVYLALYRTVMAAPDLYQAPLFLWITDLSQADPYFVLPLVLGIVMFLQQKMAPTGNMDPTQRKIMLWMMPIMFSAMMINLPSGLVYYILINSILSVFQQLYIYKQKDAADTAALSPQNP